MGATSPGQSQQMQSGDQSNPYMPQQSYGNGMQQPYQPPQQYPSQQFPSQQYQQSSYGSQMPNSSSDYGSQMQTSGYGSQMQPSDGGYGGNKGGNGMQQMQALGVMNSGDGMTPMAAPQMQPAPYGNPDFMDYGMPNPNVTQKTPLFRNNS